MFARDPEYLRYIRSLPCYLCSEDGKKWDGVPLRTEASHHHLGYVAGQKAMGIKTDDYLTIPLCLSHHRQFHDGNLSENPRWAALSPDALAALILRYLLNYLRTKCPDQPDYKGFF